MNSCNNCGSPVELFSNGKPKKFCSRNCSNAYYRNTSTKTCDEDGCDKKFRARGLCAGHYNKKYGKPNVKIAVPCDWCGQEAMKDKRANRYAHTYCGLACRDKARRLTGETSELPADHWGRWYGASSTWNAPEPKESRPTFFANTCKDCASTFVERAYGVPSDYCSTACSRRVHKRRRRAREYNAEGNFSYSQIMRQYAAQGHACAYCKEPCIGLPDPEHVTPLSRGGRNDMSNLVAACRACNADKNDLTLDEWAADRERRALPKVDTTLKGREYWHLMRATPTSEAWRNQTLAA